MALPNSKRRLSIPLGVSFMAVRLHWLKTSTPKTEPHDIYLANKIHGTSLIRVSFTLAEYMYVDTLTYSMRDCCLQMVIVSDTNIYVGAKTLLNTINYHHTKVTTPILVVGLTRCTHHHSTS
jgi:hypothetical protein